MKRSITLSTLPLLTFISCTCATMLLLAACVNHIAEKEEEVVSEERHKVRITTRVGEESLPYPVSIYAFGTE